jgi:hypothetical protein
MSGELRFDGKVPFSDKRTGGKIEVRVFGVFVGQGVDAHEEKPIQEWIMNALASSALAFDGDVHDLPRIAGEWGQYISQQLSPQLAQYFNAHGQLHIQGVELPSAAQPAYAAPPAQPAYSAPAPHRQEAPSSALLEAAAAALSARMGAPMDQARTVAAIVLEVVAAHGGAAPQGKDAYGKDPYAQRHGKDAYDPSGKGDWKK